MNTLCITGGKPLSGVITGQVSKNAFIPILAASMLCTKEVTLKNTPKILDVEIFRKIMTSLGIKIEKRAQNTLVIKADSIDAWKITQEYDGRARGLVLMLGTLGTRFGQVEIPYPGGCKIGSRKLDAHYEVMRGLGYDVTEFEQSIFAKKVKHGDSIIHLSFPSVSATLLALIMSCLRRKETTLINPAKEPEIVDMADFLNAMGARIHGAGSSVIKIIGVSQLNEVEYEVIPDRIVSGTYLAMAALVGKGLKVKRARIDHLKEVVKILNEASIELQEKNGSIEVQCDEITPFNVTTSVYPGFPTDLQPIFTTLALAANGTSRITETMYNQRFAHIKELRKMGAKISIQDNNILIHGGEKLHGSEVRANDLRAGAALVLAGLIAQGTTKISNISQVDRGYENIDQKLSGIGATLWRE